MRWVLLVLALAILGLLAFRSGAFGQENILEQRKEVTLASPVEAFPLGPYSLESRIGIKTYDENALFLEDGLSVEADAVAMISEHFGFLVGGGVGWTETALEVFRACESCAAIADQTGRDVTVLEGHVGVRAYLTSLESRVKPYVAGGFGGYRFYSDAEDYSDKNAWELYTALGLQAALSRGVGLAVNLGFNPMQCKLFNRETQADVMSATVGIAYVWGGKKKREEPPMVRVETPPTPARPTECVPPKYLDSIMMNSLSYNKWGEVFTPSDGISWRRIGETVMGLPIYVHGGLAAPYRSIFVEVCPGLFQEFQTEIQATTG